MAISRLFTEIGKDVDRLNASLRQSMESAKEAGVQVTASGQRMLAAFDRALNPSKDLAEQIHLLEKAGKSGSDIWKVYGDRMKTASDAAQNNGQAIDPLIAKHINLNKVTESGKFNFDGLGKTVQNFASNPLEAAKSGIAGLLETVGPLAVGMFTMATGVAVAGKALFDMGAEAADEAEHLENLSISTGLRTQELQALAEISKEAGLEGLDFGRQIGKLNEQLGSKAGGDFTKALVANGIALEDSNGKSKSAIVLLDELRKIFIGIHDPIERAREMQNALGGKLRDLIPLLMASNESLEKQINVMEKTGPVWDDITQNKLMAFDKTLDMLHRTWKTVVTDIKAGVGSILGDLSRLPQEPVDPARLSDEEAVKYYGSMRAGGLKPIPQIESPFANIKVDAESFRGAEKISREVFEAQQKLIAQGADHIQLRMRLSQEQTKFDNLLNKGTPEKVAAQALVLRGLNEQLKTVLALEKETEKLTEAQKMTDIQFLSKIAELSQKERNTFSLEMPKKEKERSPAEDYQIISAASVEKAKNDIKEISDSMDEYRKKMAGDRESLGSLIFKDEYSERMAVIRDYYMKIEELRATDYLSEEEYTNAKRNLDKETEAAKLSRYKSFLGNMQELQSSNIRAIAAIGKAAAIAQATINTYEGATKALAQGGIWGALQMGAVLAAGFAQVAEISAQGFREGGLVTGGEQLIRVNEDGRPEFMVNADATAEYLPFLQAINAGRGTGSQMDSGMGFPGFSRGGLNVTIANYGTSKAFQVEQLDENTVRIIARDEAFSVLSRKGPEIIANDMSSANSRTSKAIARHTTARRGDR